ncbi:hypothetical protein B0T20DRAFT_506043 [Sordaria brevicollis]|uniref:Uncharacterized protein n=1 Tax=Sordaria brevicollis TaxID=83679 RepID=A0AAE0UDL0_SORBR|nr:hypothetical protein B0T20DRAFT_506043 [Sordaria brevicollis]
MVNRHSLKFLVEFLPRREGKGTFLGLRILWWDENDIENAFTGSWIVNFSKFSTTTTLQLEAVGLLMSARPNFRPKEHQIERYFVKVVDTVTNAMHQTPGRMDPTDPLAGLGLTSLDHENFNAKENEESCIRKALEEIYLEKSQTSG